MKKHKYEIFLVLLSVVLIFSLTSCSWGNNLFVDRNQKAADDAFAKVVEAINTKNEGLIIELFSNNVKNGVDLQGQAVFLIEYIEGEIVSFTTAKESGLITSEKSQHGKRKKEITPCFVLHTTEKTYHFAIKICMRDDSDKDNVGMVSLNVIESSNWPHDYVYRAHGIYLDGILINEE